MGFLGIQGGKLWGGEKDCELNIVVNGRVVQKLVGGSYKDEKLGLVLCEQSFLFKGRGIIVKES